MKNYTFLLFILFAFRCLAQEEIALSHVAPISLSMDKPTSKFDLIVKDTITVTGNKGNVPPEKILVSGHFEGNEPFWNLEITNNRAMLQCVNDTLRDTLLLSRKQQHSETYAFKGRYFFGIIKYSGKGGCTLDITEEEKPAYEIYFSYRGVTYMGCGKLEKE